MNWNLFSSKENKKTPEQSQVHKLGAPLEEPFFNVMPRAKMSNAPRPAPAPAPVPKVTPVPTPQPQSPPPPPPTRPSTAPSITVTAVPPVQPAKEQVQPSRVQGIGPKKASAGTPKAVQIIGAFVVIVVAFAAIWYAFITFGKDGKLFESFNNFWHRVPPLTEAKPNTTQAGPTEENPPVPPVPTYNTSSEWRVSNFGDADCDACGDEADADKDGLTNAEEFNSKTNPKEPDTDKDGLSDGDEVHVFLCDPVDAHTAGDMKYSDSDDLRGGWDCMKGSSGDAYMSSARKAEISGNSAKFGFHSPTVTTLGDALMQYQAASGAAAQLPAGVDTAPEAVLDRDVQRLNTIKKIGVALFKYKGEFKAFPKAASFDEMFSQVKPFMTVATNAKDPINQAPFVYGYEISPESGEFSLTYYSETQKQLIRYTSAQATLDAAGEDKRNRDTQRMEDLDKIRSALLIYSAATAEPSQPFVFPSKDQYQQKIAPQYIQTVPKDPVSHADYEYQVSKDGSSFTLKAILENPPTGTTGYMCNQEECRNY